MDPKRSYKDSVVLLPNPKSFDRAIMKDALDRARATMKSEPRGEREAKSPVPPKSSAT